MLALIQIRSTQRLVVKLFWIDSFSRQIGKTKFHKSHQFDYRNDVSVYVGEDKSGIGKPYAAISLFLCFFFSFLFNNG